MKGGNETNVVTPTEANVVTPETNIVTPDEANVVTPTEAKDETSGVLSTLSGALSTPETAFNNLLLVIIHNLLVTLILKPRMMI